MTKEAEQKCKRATGAAFSQGIQMIRLLSAAEWVRPDLGLLSCSVPQYISMLGYCWCQVAHSDFWQIYSMLWILDTLISIGCIKKSLCESCESCPPSPHNATLNLSMGIPPSPPWPTYPSKWAVIVSFTKTSRRTGCHSAPYQKLMTTHYVDIKERSSQDNSWKPKWTAHFWLRKTRMFLFGFNGASEGHCTNATLLSPNLSPYLPRAEY